jgi:hypothetical protein
MSFLLWLIGGDWIEFKIVLGVAIVVAVLWFFRGTSWGLGIAATVAALLGANLLARQGWEQKAKKDNRDAEKLIDRAVKARKKAEDAAKKSPDRLRDDDGFRRD